VFKANFSGISAISWHEQILYIKLLHYKTLRNKTCLYMKQPKAKYFNILWRK